MPLDKDEKVIKVKTALIAPNARKNLFYLGVIGLCSFFRNRSGG
jgi:hypothetical protein